MALIYIVIKVEIPLGLEFLSFGIRLCFEFRDSDFELLAKKIRIYDYNFLSNHRF
jgi:hypothetical protein